MQVQTPNATLQLCTMNQLEIAAEQILSEIDFHH
jgi:hypothetical protein